MSRRRQDVPMTGALHPDVMETVGIVAAILLRQRRREQQSMSDVSV